VTDPSQPGCLPQRAKIRLAGDPGQASAAERELYRESEAAKYGLSEADFVGILAEVACQYLPAGTPADEADLFCRSLRLEELALARACAAGSETGWEVFLTRYRARLYEMALAIAREETLARELADSVYAELYGVSTRAGHRVSKLSYYTGRGSLEGWLRTVLARDFVDRCRSLKRTVSLEEREEAGERLASGPAPAAAVFDPRLERATDEALAALGSEERFVLAAYFLDGRTFAQIGQILQAHESTVSRRVGRLTVKLRKTVIGNLRKQGLDRRAAEEALSAADVRDMGVDVRGRLRPGSDPAAAFSHSAQAGADSTFYSVGKVVFTAEGAADTGDDRRE
jgi:RNA polymerase sigma-70 factor (ECF subfamily)